MKPSSLLMSLLLGLAAMPVADAMDSWAGRSLGAVLAELRAAGLPLLYSSQIISDDLIIGSDPGVTLQLERLRLALQPFGLALQALPGDQGYAVVRAKPDNARPIASAGTALEEITVFASRYSLSRDAAQDSTGIQLPRATLEKTAGVEQDVLRSVQYLPGTSANGLSALTHVRGGYEDENLVRFDGVELYNPVHLKDFQGVFGLLDPDWVESLDFYSGAYPVRHGNHNASVIDLKPRVVSGRHFTVGASLLYTRGVSAGSYADEAGHWLLGYRRSNLQEVLSHFETRIGETEFEDLLLRHTYRFDAGELRLGALRLNDDLGLRTDDGTQRSAAHTHDSYLWLGWQQAWSQALNFNTQLTHTQLSNHRDAALQRPGITSGGLTDQHQVRMYTLDAQVDWQRSDNTQWQVGSHINQSTASYGYLSTAEYAAPLRLTFAQPATVQRNYERDFRASDQAAWLAVDHRRGAWRGELGLRYDHFDHLEQSAQFSPRLNLRYLLPAGSLHVSAGRYVQSQTLNDLDTSSATPRFYAPQRMQQYIVGWTQSWSPELQLRIEAYQKIGSHLWPRAENLLSVITLAGELELDRGYIFADRSRAQGLEISLTAKLPPHFGWWLNYNLSKVQDHIDGQYFNRRWDQPQALTAGLNWTRARWSLSASASWHSGWTYTPLQIGSDGSSATLGERNSQRFSGFASMELRAQYTRPLAIHSMHRADLELFAEVRNALNHDNPCCRELSVTADNPALISIRTQNSLPIIPIVGFNLKF